MPSSNKRRRNTGKRAGHSMRKRAEAVATWEMRNVACAYVWGDDYTRTIDIRTGRRIPTDIRIRDALVNIRYPWASFLAVFCRDQNGQEYMKAKAVVAQDRYLQSEMIDTLNEHHQALLATCNKLHVVGFGWISSPAGIDLDEARAQAIFTAMGGWDYVESGDD